MAYDYVIVGGGSAGCALANRLTEDPSRVLVLEAGRNDSLWDVYIHMPAALSFPIGNRFYDWKYESEPEPFMHGRRVYHARGKVLGGSSSINGMIFQRGNPMDYERWAGDPGMENWDYAHCLPYFKKMENVRPTSESWRGHERSAEARARAGPNPLFQAFFQAVQEAGYPLTDDVNGYRQEGFAAFDRNIYRGHRMSAARAYLHPVMDRPNLEVRTRAIVNQIHFDGTTRRGHRRRAERKDEPNRRGRGAPVRRRDQLPAAAPALRRRQRAGAAGARRGRRPRPPGGRREPPGPPRGLRPVRQQAAGVGGARDEDAKPSEGRCGVAARPSRPGCHQSLRGRWLRALQRGCRCTPT